jgi:hypothetical protein
MPESHLEPHQLYIRVKKPNKDQHIYNQSVLTKEMASHTTGTQRRTHISQLKKFFSHAPHRGGHRHFMTTSVTFYETAGMLHVLRVFN